MEKYLTKDQIKELAYINGYEYASLKAVIARESSGHGYDSITDKIVIQFEPSWFKKEFALWKSYRMNTKWLENRVENQTKEWIAFNDAFSINPDAAMEATSVGMMQVMAFHWSELLFKSVGNLWDYAKESEYNQVMLGIKFIKNNAILDHALKVKDWTSFAYRYNGPKFKDYHYDTDLARFYNHFKLEG